MTETALDLTGLMCPLPALKTRKAFNRPCIRGPAERDVYRSLSAIDIPNLLRETGDVLLNMRKDQRRIAFLIEKR